MRDADRNESACYTCEADPRHDLWVETRFMTISVLDTGSGAETDSGRWCCRKHNNRNNTKVISATLERNNDNTRNNVRGIPTTIETTLRHPVGNHTWMLRRTTSLVITFQRLDPEK